MIKDRVLHWFRTYLWSTCSSYYICCFIRIVFLLAGNNCINFDWHKNSKPL